MDLDLKAFFDHVNYDRLMSHLGQKVRDKRILRLIGDYLRAPLQRKDGRQEPRREGTPQGGPLSPLLANITLHPLDLELEKRGLSFVRYADDIAIFCSSERSAARVEASVTAWIERELTLPVNREKSGHGPSEELREQWRSYIRGWWGYFRLTERRWDVTDLSGWIRRHMRKCFWLRWHHPRGRLNALQRLGLRGINLGMAYSGKGAWAIARHWVLQRALNNRTLERYGFTLPWETATTPVVL